MEKMLVVAKRTKKNAYAPYSQFKVGASVKSCTGEVYGGCNVENASYGLSMCAERVAIYKAAAEGHRGLKEILICSDTDFVTPCGACRQVMHEFGIEQVHLVDDHDEIKTYKLEELLPLAFSDKDLNNDREK